MLAVDSPAQSRLFGRGASNVCRAYSRLGRALPVLRPRALVRAPGGSPPAGARFLDRVLGRDRLFRPGNDGPAVRPDGPLPLRHRAVGRGRPLPLSPPDLADRGRPGRGARGDHARRPAGSVRAAPFLRRRAVGRRLRIPGAFLADRAGGHGPVARGAGHPIRDVARRPHRARGRRRHRGAPAHGGMGLLPDRSVEAGAVDRPDGLLDRAAALRAHRQAAVHAPAPLPRRGGARRNAATRRRW